MTHPQPASGIFEGGVHRFPVRVYFEDTDLSGIVYHANYLRYMERARSDMLMLAGIDQRRTFEAGEGVYALANLEIAYKRPAKLDDVLIVESRVSRVRAAATDIEQSIMRSDAEKRELVTRAVVTAALIAPDTNGVQRPVRQPADWRKTFTSLMEQAKGDHAV
ncbi:YbgC/FadM family acyl-CoA thioesterase [Pacificimonas sp. ICDLI1SI03]|jgi:acyl-CoA thioester hydrolase|tara:strand:+ start:2009 stop:2497 length:489 start_codon:yes stop_codon:yes gene_type:complete